MNPDPVRTRIQSGPGSSPDPDPDPKHWKLPSADNRKKRGILFAALPGAIPAPAYLQPSALPPEVHLLRTRGGNQASNHFRIQPGPDPKIIHTRWDICNLIFEGATCAGCLKFFIINFLLLHVLDPDLKFLDARSS